MHPVVGIASWFMLLAPFILLPVDVTTAADNLEKQTKALNIIADFANRICETVPQTGTSGNIELTGKAKAELNELLKKIANLGIEGAAQYQASEWKGVLQQELAEQLNRSRDCKREVSKDLINRLLSVELSRQETKPTEPISPPTTDSLPPPTLSYIPSLETQVTSLQFFEGTNNPSTRKQRKYSQRFSTKIRNSYSSNIHWELCLKYPPKRSQKDFGIGWKVLDDDGRQVSAVGVGGNLQPNTSNSCHTGVIYRMLDPGIYRFDIYVEKELVASNSFEVY